ARPSLPDAPGIQRAGYAGADAREVPDGSGEQRGTVQRSPAPDPGPAGAGCGAHRGGPGTGAGAAVPEFGELLPAAQRRASGRRFPARCPAPVSALHSLPGAPPLSASLADTLPLEAEGGAVPLQSRFYVERETDGQFRTAIGRRDSIVLVRGARQIGKTSLLARGLDEARQSGAKVVLTDFQTLSPAHLESTEALCRALGAMIAEQLDLDFYPEDLWEPGRGANANFSRYLARVALE